MTVFAAILEKVWHLAKIMTFSLCIYIVAIFFQTWTLVDTTMFLLRLPSSHISYQITIDRVKLAPGCNRVLPFISNCLTVSLFLSI